ncbi:MAG TPA: hypothetical protein VKE70_03915 [Candidatus Solibacter sp.]|nr:hypothetical protein [Candidatus Solibacter sp.]
MLCKPIWILVHGPLHGGPVDDPPTGAVYRIGDRHVGTILERHVVHYWGELNHAGTNIEGNWWIEPVLKALSLVWSFRFLRAHA